MNVPQTSHSANALYARELLAAARLSIPWDNGAGPGAENEREAGPALLRLWKMRTLADAYPERPPQQYVIEGLFLLPSLNIVYGSPGSLKSMLLADASVCVAGGQPWLPPLPNGEGRPLNTMSVPVLWLDVDNGPRRSDERFGALARTRGLSQDDRLYYVSMPSPWLDASSKANVEALAELILHLGAKLVVIDNLGLVTGPVEENSAEMAHVMGHLRQLCEETVSAVVPIHHQRKGNGTVGRKGESLRGHSSIEAAVDLALLVEREEQGDLVTVTATKVRGADVPALGALFTYEHRPGTKELARARFFRQELEDTRSDQAIDRAIIEAISGGTLKNKTTLVEKVKERLTEVGVNRIRGRIDVLAAVERIQQLDGGRTEKFYTIQAD